MVQTATRSPTAPPSGDGGSVPKASRRRWFWWLLAGLLALVMAAAATGIVLVANYQPFTPGYRQYGPPPGVQAEEIRVNWLGMQPNLRVFEIPTEDRMTFRYRLSIWNHGPVPITVTRLGIPASEQAGEGLTLVPVALYPDVYRIPELGGEWIPVQPVKLEPRQMMGVEMEVSVASCTSGVRWNTIPITFEMYGVERHVLAPTNVQIDLVRSADC